MSKRLFLPILLLLFFLCGCSSKVPEISGTETAMPSGILCRPMSTASTRAALSITPLLLA